jgi:alpha-D-ribose 1-methylphosphonate 5-triphosphate diphosphatase
MNMSEIAFTNAKVVLPDAVIEGRVAVADGIVVDVAEGDARDAGALDLDGDYLVPGLLELHTDHLEAHFSPRPKVIWPAEAAVVAHDAQIVASGITTVFDALRVGNVRGEDSVSAHMAALARAIREAGAAGRLRADHLVHLRCELACEDTIPGLTGLIDDDGVRLISVMDHTPGQRQFVNLVKFREYYQGKVGFTDAQMEAFIAERCAACDQLSAPNRAGVVAMARARNIPLASHDDATPEHVEEASQEGASISEFPTSIDAAEAARERGLMVLMGAPNVVRGGSHSGNVSALDLARRGLLDILSSDYVPYSLLQAAFALPHRDTGMDLPAAIRTVTANPAAAVGLEDRGAIAVGKRADLIRVRLDGEFPVMRAAWRQGERVM